MEAIRTPDENFEGLRDWPYQPHYMDWNGLRLAYVDEGQGPIVLLVHGEPDWGYMYRDTIAALVKAGYRAVCMDFIGFGRSDKVVDDGWYTARRHMDSLTHFIETLDIKDATLVVHDWGGPIGLRQLVDMPQRFSRCIILNTWLHHDGFEYSEGIKGWRDFATSFEPATGDMPAANIMWASSMTKRQDEAAIRQAYDAPFTGPESKAGIRRFPWMLPFAQPVEGDAAGHQECFDALKAWDKCPIHLVFSDSDPIFTPDWAKQWAGLIPGATLEFIEGPGHFVACEAGGEVAERIIRLTER